MQENTRKGVFLCTELSDPLQCPYGPFQDPALFSENPLIHLTFGFIYANIYKKEYKIWAGKEIKNGILQRLDIYKRSGKYRDYGRKHLLIL